MSMHEYTYMYDQNYVCKYMCMHLQIHTRKANGRETKQLKLLPPLHSQVSLCQTSHGKNYSMSG